MSERERGILLTIAIVVLTVYIVIDCICDRQDEWHMRDIQRRVGQLDSGSGKCK